MIKIRKNVFETNSSSMHSVALCNNKGYYTREEIEEEREIVIRDNILVVKEEDSFFGWGFEVLTTFYQKLMYTIASLSTDDALIAVQKVFPEVEEIKMIPQDNKNGELVKATGSVDHQSYGTLQGFLEKQNIDIAEFLYNKKYMVIIDNDNTCTWADYVMSGIFHVEEMEK